jgi:predicted O-methyltransferase YrrM
MFLGKTVAANLINNLLTRKKTGLWHCELKRLARNTDEVACIQALFPQSSVPSSFVEQCLEEVRSAADLQENVERYSKLTGVDWKARLASRHLPIIFFTYAAIRWLRPQNVIETGCASGWITSLILLALYHNKSGHLWSLDLPPRDSSHGMKWTLPDSLEPGFVVPPRLRDRWTLELGDTRDTLIPVLNKLGSVDYFLHDSDHSYCHMMWEYTTAWPFLRKGGLLVSDDISMNVAFWDFSIATHCCPILHQATINVGGIVKP